ncbi:hypothetical protein J6590_010194 [Homalodisca vitripennis]|nr:hypothetical protein J6590_010194 [Homalodisca vitripennis]
MCYLAPSPLQERSVTEHNAVTDRDPGLLELKNIYGTGTEQQRRNCHLKKKNTLARTVTRLWYGGETLQLPAWEDLSFETRHVCEQFISHHLDQCRQDIITDTRWRLRRYRQVFSGSSLVSWLVAHSVVADRSQAAEYCSHLVLGRVIAHVGGSQPFLDHSDTWYGFVSHN